MPEKPSYEALEEQVRQLQQKVEEQNKKKEELQLLGAITENMSESVIATNVNFEITYLNKKAEALFGYGIEEVRGQTPAIFNAEPMVDALQAELYKTVSAGATYVGKHLNKRKNGSTFICEYKVFPLVGENRTTYAYVGIQRDITVQKRQEDALNLLSLVLDQIHDCVTVTDVNGVTSYVNQVQAKRLGKSKAAITGQPGQAVEERFDQQMGQKEIVEKTLKEGYWRDEIINYDQDGNERFMDCRNSVVRDEQGVPVAVCCIARDVTRYRLSEKALFESEAKFRTLVNQAPAALFLHDMDGNILDVNKAAIDGYGYSRPQLLTMNAKDIDPDYIEREDKGAFWKQLRTQQTTQFEGVHRRRDATLFPVRVSLSPILLNGERHIFAMAVNMTDYKKAEEKLRDSEERFRTVFKQAAVGVALLSANGVFLELNEKFSHIVGYDKNELRQMVFRDITHPDDLHLDDFYIQKVMAGEINAFEIEKRYIHKNGESVWVRLYSNVVRNGDGQIKYAVAVVTDISEQKNAEEALQKSEREKSAILDAISELVAYQDLNYNILWTNRAAADSVNKTQTTLAGKKCYEIWAGRQSPCTNCPLADAIETGKVHSNKIHTPDGRILFVTGYPVINDEGRIIGAVEVTTDITKNEQIEKAIWETKQKYQSIVENIGIGVSLISKNMEIIDLNRQMREWFPNVDLREKPICYKMFNDPSGDTICSWCPTHESLRDGQVHESITQTPEGGEIRNFRIVSSPIINAEGEVTAAIEMVEDITERLKFEEQIQQAQRMESIGNLAGGIAHDFNNILFPIIGMAELLLEDLPENSLQFENAQEILQAGKRGSDLVNQILAFSRRTEHKKMPVRFQQILKEVIKLARSTIPANIKISQQIENDCGLVTANPTQIHQVVMNLITNAYHAIDPGNGEISIELKETGSGNDAVSEGVRQTERCVMLAISDTGSGIPPEIIEKVFEPYFTTKEQGKGTGLGLAVVYGIVKEHGGDIQIESQIGKGTTFRVYLPLYEKAVESISSSEKKTFLPGGDARILLVDDEKSIVYLEKQMLERMGYLVTSRTGSLEALEAFREHPDRFDLVISDMTMPYMTGDQLARELLSIRPDVSIIVCTGFTERIDPEMATAIGIKGVLIKPICRAELGEMVRNILDTAERQTQGR